MAGDRPFDDFFRISARAPHVEITIGGKTYVATADAAREIGQNMIRKAAEVEAARTAPRRGHLRRVK